MFRRSFFSRSRPLHYVMPAGATTQQALVLATACFLAGACSAWAVSWALSARLHADAGAAKAQRQRRKPAASGPHARVCDGVLGAIGHTPLIRIDSLSRETGCEVYGKAEFLNPGGSVKDRVALQMVQEAFAAGALSPGALITEGTAGSTGVSLAMVAAAYGCRCFIAMPDDAAVEKADMLRALGAEVERVRPVSITHPNHHINVARRRAAQEAGAGPDPLLQPGDEPGAADQPLASSPLEPHASGPHLAHQASAVFADQFENLANYRAHLKTGEEIWEQAGGRLDAFVSGAGTGGTIAGVSSVLKKHDPAIRVFLIDPPGSSLYNKVTRGVMYAREEAEGKRLRNPFDTITEGIGINRLTANFDLASIDGAFKGSDREAVEMAHYLLRNDGLFIGSSAAMNCVGAVKAARRLGPGHTVVTVLCDGGHRHLSKFHSPEYLQAQGLTPRATGSGLDFVLG